MNHSSHNLESLEQEFREAKDRILRDGNMRFADRQAELERIRDEYHQRRAVLQGLASPVQEGQEEEQAHSPHPIFNRRHRPRWK